MNIDKILDQRLKNLGADNNPQRLKGLSATLDVAGEIR